MRLPACLKLQFEVPFEVKFNYFYFLNCTFLSALEILQKTAHLCGAENWQSARFCLVRFPLLMLNCSNSGIRSGLIKALDCTFANLPLIIQWRYPTCIHHTPTLLFTSSAHEFVSFATHKLCFELLKIRFNVHLGKCALPDMNFKLRRSDSDLSLRQ